MRGRGEADVLEGPTDSILMAVLVRMKFDTWLRFVELVSLDLETRMRVDDMRFM